MSYFRYLFRTTILIFQKQQLALMLAVIFTLLTAYFFGFNWIFWHLIFWLCLFFGFNTLWLVVTAIALMLSIPFFLFLRLDDFADQASVYLYFALAALVILEIGRFVKVNYRIFSLQKSLIKNLQNKSVQKTEYSSINFNLKKNLKSTSNLKQENSNRAVSKVGLKNFQQNKIKTENENRFQFKNSFEPEQAKLFENRTPQPTVTKPKTQEFKRKLSAVKKASDFEVSKNYNTKKFATAQTQFETDSSNESNAEKSFGWTNFASTLVALLSGLSLSIFIFNFNRLVLFENFQLVKQYQNPSSEFASPDFILHRFFNLLIENGLDYLTLWTTTLQFGFLLCLVLNFWAFKSLINFSKLSQKTSKFVSQGLTILFSLLFSFSPWSLERVVSGEFLLLISASLSLVFLSQLSILCLNNSNQKLARYETKSWNLLILLTFIITYLSPFLFPLLAVSLTLGSLFEIFNRLKHKPSTKLQIFYANQQKQSKTFLIQSILTKSVLLLASLVICLNAFGNLPSTLSVNQSLAKDFSTDLNSLDQIVLSLMGRTGYKLTQVDNWHLQNLFSNENLLQTVYPGFNPAIAILVLVIVVLLIAVLGFYLFKKKHWGQALGFLIPSLILFGLSLGENRFSEFLFTSIFNLNTSFVFLEKSIFYLFGLSLFLIWIIFGLASLNKTQIKSLALVFLGILLLNLSPFLVLRSYYNYLKPSLIIQNLVDSCNSDKTILQFPFYAQKSTTINRYDQVLLKQNFSDVTECQVYTNFEYQFIPKFNLDTPSQTKKFILEAKPNQLTTTFAQFLHQDSLENFDNLIDILNQIQIDFLLVDANFNNNSQKLVDSLLDYQVEFWSEESFYIFLLG